MPERDVGTVVAYSLSRGWTVPMLHLLPEECKTNCGTVFRVECHPSASSNSDTHNEEELVSVYVKKVFFHNLIYFSFNFFFEVK